MVMKKKFSFIFQGKKFNLEVKECKNLFSKIKGLMFSHSSVPLLFIFTGKTKGNIHSFFCEPFVALWFDGDRIVDIQNIRYWKFSINPGKRYDKLLEIPLGNKFYKLILDGMRKI